MITASILIATAAFTGGCDDRENTLLPTGPVRPISFAVFGNTGRAADGDEAFFRLADAMNTAGIDFAVDVGNRLPEGIRTGDLADAWVTAETRTDSLHVPIYPIAGNGDVFDAASDREYAARFGPRWFSFQRNGVMFVVIDTGDGAYREGFGNRARIGGEQAAWLGKIMGMIDPDAPLAVFMHRPLWATDPVLWRDTLLPLLRQGGADLVVTSCDDGLSDWGEVDGIRAVSTGCVAPTENIGAGLFPHALVITVTGSSINIETMTPESGRIDGIPVDTAFRRAIGNLRDTFTMPVLAADASWNVGETVRLSISNAFDDTLQCNLDFTVYSGTSWRIEPQSVDEVLAPGDERTINIPHRGCCSGTWPRS